MSKYYSVFSNFKIIIKEFSFRSFYIWLFLCITLLNCLFFWDELLILLFTPLEETNQKANYFILHNFLPWHYVINETKLDTFFNVTKINEYEYTNDIPYFEINISSTTNLDMLILYVGICVTINIVLPYCIYQYILFMVPITYQYKVNKAIKKYCTYLINILISNIALLKITIPLILKSVMTATEEVGYYAFETDFNFFSYLGYVTSILVVHTTILFFTIYIKYNRYYMYYCILFIGLLNIIHTSTSELLYTLLLIMLLLFFKRTILRIRLLTHIYYLRVSKKTKGK